MTTVKTLLLAAVLPLTLVSSSPASASTLKIKGGTPSTVTICGKGVKARSVGAGERVTVRLRGKGRLKVQTCKNSRWVKPRRAKKRVALKHSFGDYRIRGGHKKAYVRFGVGELVDTTFTANVVNQNTTIAGCSPDGLQRTIRGHLTGPRAALAGLGRTATLLLHGFGYGEFFWRFREVPGYDAARQLALKSHVVVTVDRAGYGTSKSPADGTTTCIGSQADMAHQLADDLKSGNYTLGAKNASLTFSRVALVGHSAAGAMVELDAASFDDVDAIGIVSYNDSGFTPLTLAQLGMQTFSCPAGAEGTPGFAPFGATDADFTEAHLNAPTDPAVAAAVLRLRAPEPCGDVTSAPGAVVALEGADMTISGIPVLLVIGDSDHVFDPSNESLQDTRMTSGGAEVTATTIGAAGHAITLGLSHLQFVAELSRWLTASGF